MGYVYWLDLRESLSVKITIDMLRELTNVDTMAAGRKMRKT